MDSRQTYHSNPKWPFYFLKKHVDSLSQHFSSMTLSILSISWMNIDLDLFIDSTIQRKDAGIVITMLGGDPTSFAQYCFLDYLCQQVRQHEHNLEWEQCWAQTCINWLLARWSTTRLYEWVIHHITQPPHSSWQSSPYNSSNTSSSTSSQPLPIPPPQQQSSTPFIPICTSPIVTEAWQQQWHWDLQRKPNCYRYQWLWRLIQGINWPGGGFFPLSSTLHCVPDTCSIITYYYMFYPFSFTPSHITCFIPCIALHSQVQLSPYFFLTCITYIYLFIVVYKLTRVDNSSLVYSLYSNIQASLYPLKSSGLNLEILNCISVENSDWREKVMNWPKGMSWKLGAIYMFPGVCTDHLQNI